MTEEVHQFVYRDDLAPGPVSTVVGYASSGATERVHRGVPSPYLTFILSLDDPIATSETPERLRADPHRTSVLVGGLHTAPAYVWSPARQAGLQLAVHPLAARALLGATTAELSFPAVDGTDVLGLAAERLRQRLLDVPDWAGRFALLQHYLHGRLERAPRSSRARPELHEAWRQIARTGGTGSVTQLSRHVLLSPRQLGQVFRSEVGLGPKAVIRLVRFQRAMRRITAAVAVGTSPDLGRIAAESGYADQSHLNRDFAGYVGTSPTGWLAEERRNIQAGGHRNGEA